MTTKWQPDGSWAGQSVLVLLPGTTMSPALASDLMAKHDRTIVVNDMCKHAPAADLLVALDGNWEQAYRDFQGMRVTGTKDDDLDALYVGHVSQRIAHPTLGNIDIRNSGLHAVVLAAQMGAASVLVAGFEPESGVHFYDKDDLDKAPDPYIGVRVGMEQIAAELRGVGVAVEFYEPPVATLKPTRAPRRPGGDGWET